MSESVMAKQQIEIVFNGDVLSIEKDITIMDLLQLFEVETRRFVVVINDQIIPKSTYMTTQLELGDHCDIISPISGG
jgi:thiamine biosynthesis protein ThiS